MPPWRGVSVNGIYYYYYYHCCCYYCLYSPDSQGFIKALNQPMRSAALISMSCRIIYDGWISPAKSPSET